MQIDLDQNERIDDLEFKNLKIIQNKDGFCFGMDSVLDTEGLGLNDKKNKVYGRQRSYDITEMYSIWAT